MTRACAEKERERGKEEDEEEEEEEQDEEEANPYFTTGVFSYDASPQYNRLKIKQITD